MHRAGLQGLLEDFPFSDSFHSSSILCILCWSRRGLAAFCLDWYCFGLVAASFAVFFGFVNFVLVSAALAAICLVLDCLWRFRCFVLVLRGFVEDADPRLITDAKFCARDANPTPSANNICNSYSASFNELHEDRCYAFHGRKVSP